MSLPGETGKVCFARFAALLLNPNRCWPEIGAEPARPLSLFLRYALPLAAIGPVSLFFGAMWIGVPVGGAMFFPSWQAALGAAMAAYAMALITVFALAGVVNAFAPVFDGERDFAQALKLAIFVCAPGWLASIFLTIPGLWVVTALIALYGLYLLYLGLPVVMDVSRQKAGVYTALVGAILLVMWGVSALSSAAIARAVMIPPPGAGAPTGRIAMKGIGSVDLDKAAAAIENHAPVVVSTPEELEILLPREVEDYVRSELVGNQMNVGRVSGSMARGVYLKDGKRVTLTVSDIGAAKALTDAFKIKSSRRTDTSYEIAGPVDGRMTIEKYDRTANAGEYSVLVAGRFLVQARGQASIGLLKNAVQAVPFDRLEAMANG